MDEMKFTTKTDFEVFKDYWMFTLFEKKGANGKWNAFAKYMLILCIVLGAAVVLAICNFTVLDQMMGIVPLILLLAVVAAFASCYITVTKTQPKRQYKLVQQAIENPQKYTFTAQQMEVREDDAEQGRETLAVFPYEKLIETYETAKAFYIFISAMEAFLIPKDQLKPSETQELAAFLSNEMKDKYHKTGSKK